MLIVAIVSQLFKVERIYPNRPVKVVQKGIKLKNMRYMSFEVFLSKKVQAYSIYTREHRGWKRRGRGIVMEAEYDFSQGKRRAIDPTLPGKTRITIEAVSGKSKLFCT